MTDTILASPFSLLGRKRSNVEEEEMVVEPSYLHSAKRNRHNTDSPVKSFTNDYENFSPQAGQNVNQRRVEVQGNFPRPNLAFSAALNTQTYIDHLNKSHEAQLNLLRSESQKSIDTKDREIQQLKALSSKLMVDMQKGAQDNHNLQEENKVLKRAVQLQDAKTKELCQQIEQYQQVIRLATEHIQNLEHANRMLREEMDLARNGRFNNFGPPDVY